MPPRHARDCAEVLVLADERGYEGNGTMQLPTYVRHLRAGELTAAATIRRQTRGSVMVVDGGGALGHVVARQAFRWAITAAKRRGVAVGITHSHGYTGVLGVYVRQAARQGMLALYLQTTQPFLGVPGSGRRLIGNNPIAFSCPVQANSRWSWTCHAASARWAGSEWPLQKVARSHLTGL